MKELADHQSSVRLLVLTLIVLANGAKQAIANAAMMVQTGMSDVVVAGGVESMSNVEHYSIDVRKGVRAGNLVLHDRLTRGRLMSQPVERFDTPELHALITDLQETMIHAHGAGLAAPQIGITKQLIVLDCEKAPHAPRPLVMFNPEITWSSDELFTYEEGCLSVPEYYDSVERPARVRLRYINYAGETVEEEAEGLYAVCIQHEMDHLEGILFIDHLSRLKRQMALKKLQKLRAA